MSIESVASISFVASGDLPSTRTIENTSLPNLFWANPLDRMVLGVGLKALKLDGNPVNDETDEILAFDCNTNPTGTCFYWEYRTQNNPIWTGVLGILGPSNRQSISFIYDTEYNDTYNEYRCTVSIQDPLNIETVNSIISNTHRIYSNPQTSVLSIDQSNQLVTYNHNIDVDYTEMSPSVLSNIVSIQDYNDNKILFQSIYLSQYPNQSNKSEFEPLSIEEARTIIDIWNGPGIYYYRANATHIPGKRPKLDTSTNPEKTFKFSNNTESRPLKKYIINTRYPRIKIFLPSHQVADSVVPPGGEVTSTITAAATSGDYVVYTSNHSFASGSFVNVSGLASGWNTSDMTNLNGVWVAQSGSGYFSIPNFSKVTGSITDASGTARLKVISPSSSGNFHLGFYPVATGSNLNSDDISIYESGLSWSYTITSPTSVVMFESTIPSIIINEIHNIEYVKYISTLGSYDTQAVWKKNYVFSSINSLNNGQTYTIVSTGNLPFTLSYSGVQPSPVVGESGDWHAYSCVGNSGYYLNDSNLLISESGIYYVLTTTNAPDGGCYNILPSTGVLSSGIGNAVYVVPYDNCVACTGDNPP